MEMLNWLCRVIMYCVMIYYNYNAEKTLKCTTIEPTDQIFFNHISSMSFDVELRFVPRWRQPRIFIEKINLKHSSFLYFLLYHNSSTPNETRESTFNIELRYLNSNSNSNLAQ